MPATEPGLRCIGQNRGRRRRSWRSTTPPASLDRRSWRKNRRPHPLLRPSTAAMDSRISVHPRTSASPTSSATSAITRNSTRGHEASNRSTETRLSTSTKSAFSVAVAVNDAMVARIRTADHACANRPVAGPTYLAVPNVGVQHPRPGGTTASSLPIGCDGNV